MKHRFPDVLTLPGFDLEPDASTVPAIVRGFTVLSAVRTPQRDDRPDVDDMTAAELRAELAAHGYDDDEIDRLPNWTSLAGAVRKIRRP